jgi:acyl carrier protein
MRKSVNYMLVIAAVTAGAGKESDSVAGTPAECTSTQRSGVEAHTTLERRVLALLVKQLGLKPGKVTLAADVVDDLGADSLDCVEIVMALEEEFGIAIADEDAEKLHNATQIVAYLCTHQVPATKS